MILNLIEMHGITGRIEGEYLQGGIGELQAMGLVRVLVADEDYAAARQIIEDWEAIQPPADEPKPEERAPGGIQVFLAGVIVGAALTYWLLKAHAALPG